MNVFKNTIDPFLPKIFEGLNLGVICYGGEESGKSYTLNKYISNIHIYIIKNCFRIFGEL